VRLDDEEAAGLLAPVPEEARGESWWIVLRDGRLVRGDEGGGVALLAAIRLTRPLAGALGMLGGSRLLDVFDKLVARYRARLGRVVPEGPAPRRYP
jgi:hypothetical protein